MITAKQYYQCGKCNFSFIAADDYPDDPQTRNCPECKDAKGEIMYLGIGKSNLHIIRDDLGLHGIRSQADGKQYDSKSQYRKSLRQHGFVEVGNEPMPTKKRELRGNYDCRKEVAQAIEQTGFMEKRKKK